MVVTKGKVIVGIWRVIYGDRTFRLMDTLPYFTGHILVC